MVPPHMTTINQVWCKWKETQTKLFLYLKLKMLTQTSASPTFVIATKVGQIGQKYAKASACACPCTNEIKDKPRKNSKRRKTFLNYSHLHRPHIRALQFDPENELPVKAQSTYFLISPFQKLFTQQTSRLRQNKLINEVWASLSNASATVC